LVGGVVVCWEVVKEIMTGVLRFVASPLVHTTKKTSIYTTTEKNALIF
jgi:hypothetical protein